MSDPRPYYPWQPTTTGEERMAARLRELEQEVEAKIRQSPPMTDTGPSEAELAEWERLTSIGVTVPGALARTLAALRAANARGDALAEQLTEEEGARLLAVDQAHADFVSAGRVIVKLAAERDAALARAERAEAALRDAPQFVHGTDGAQRYSDWYNWRRAGALTPSVQGGEEPKDGSAIDDGFTRFTKKLAANWKPAQPGAAEE